MEKERIKGNTHFQHQNKTKQNTDTHPHLVQRSRSLRPLCIDIRIVLQQRLYDAHMLIGACIDKGSQLGKVVGVGWRALAQQRFHLWVKREWRGGGGVFECLCGVFLREDFANKRKTKIGKQVRLLCRWVNMRLWEKACPQTPKSF